MLVFILIAELIILFILSGRVTQAIYMLLLMIFRTRTIAMPILLVIEFPGTVIHELSHLFTAGILGVRTGKLQLVPEDIREEHVKAGSVAIAETDPFRKYVIGLAPVTWGITLLCTLAYFIPQIQNPYLLLLIGYCLFVISNTMFSSDSDLSGFLPFALTLGAFAIVFYLLGVRIALTGTVLTTATQILATLTKSLGIVLAVNIVILVVTWIITTILAKLLRIRIVK